MARTLDTEAQYSAAHDTFLIRVHDGRTNHARLPMRPSTFESLMRKMMHTWEVSGRKL